MYRRIALLIAITLATPAAAAGDEVPYYGPMKRVAGIRYDVGYADRADKNGQWRIEASVHRGDALDMAMYRAAERARDAGFAYVQFLRGEGMSAQPRGFASILLARGNVATVWVRPAASADAPPGCKPVRWGGCYTARVADVLYRLGGPGGTQPGVAIVDHYDKFGRPVQLSGFGIGAVDGRATTVSVVKDGRLEVRSRGTAPAAAPATPSSVPPKAATAIVLPPRTIGVPRTVAFAAAAPAPAPAAIDVNSGRSAIEAQARFEAARAAQQPVRGGDRRQGWTISD